MKILLLFLTLTLVACGSDGDSPPSDKDLFSLWESENGFLLDLSGMTFGEPRAFNFYLEGGAVCTCDLAIIGTQSSGGYSVFNCYNSSTVVFDCSIGNETGTYTKSGNMLTICGDTCTNYY